MVALEPRRCDSVLTSQQVAQLQKQKAKKAGEKKKDEVDTKAQDQAADSNAPSKEEDPVEQEPAVEELKETPAEQESDETTDTPSKPSHGRQPSLSVQSKMRSSSFRRSSLSLQNVDSPTTAAKSPTLPPLSPEGGTMPDIYRKQAIRIEELERENKRLEKEARDGESRWRKSEEELEDLREGNTEVVELKARASRAEKKSEEVDKLVRSSPNFENNLIVYRNSRLHLFSVKYRSFKARSPFDLPVILQLLL